MVLILLSYFHNFVFSFLLFPQQALLPIKLSLGMISTRRELHSRISCTHECHFPAQQEDSTSRSRFPTLSHLACPLLHISFKCPMEQLWDPCHILESKREGHHQTRVYTTTTKQSQSCHRLLRERK